MNEKNPWQQLSSKEAYKNPWIRVREDTVLRPDGKEGLYGVVESPDSVVIVALTDDRTFSIIGQWRYPTDCYSWELPGGRIDSGEPLAAAKRELQEETGMIAKEWHEVTKMQAYCGIATDMLHVFVARNLEGNERIELLHEEAITKVRKVSFDEFWKMVASGECNECQTIAAVAAVQNFLL